MGYPSIAVRWYATSGCSGDWGQAWVVIAQGFPSDIGWHTVVGWYAASGGLPFPDIGWYAKVRHSISWYAATVGRAVGGRGGQHFVWFLSRRPAEFLFNHSPLGGGKGLPIAHAGCRFPCLGSCMGVTLEITWFSFLGQSLTLRWWLVCPAGVSKCSLPLSSAVEKEDVGDEVEDSLLVFAL